MHAGQKPSPQTQTLFIKEVISTGLYPQVKCSICIPNSLNSLSKLALGSYVHAHRTSATVLQFPLVSDERHEAKILFRFFKSKIELPQCPAILLLPLCNPKELKTGSQKMFIYYIHSIIHNDQKRVENHTSID